MLTRQTAEVENNMNGAERYVSSDLFPFILYVNASSLSKSQNNELHRPRRSSRGSLRARRHSTSSFLARSRTDRDEGRLHELSCWVSSFLDFASFLEMLTSFHLRPVFPPYSKGSTFQSEEARRSESSDERELEVRRVPLLRVAPSLKTNG